MDIAGAMKADLKLGAPPGVSACLTQGVTTAGSEFEVQRWCLPVVSGVGVAELHQIVHRMIQQLLLEALHCC